MKSVALALGGGGARGLAHIVVAEALDEMGVKPVAIAGTSIGAVIGAGYAAGMSGREMRRYAIHIAHNRTDVMRRMMRSRAGKLRNLFGGGLGDATRLDAELLCEQFLPENLPEDFVPWTDFDNQAVIWRYRDTSAASLCAYGLLRMSELDPDRELANRDRKFAIRILNSLVDHYLAPVGDSDPRPEGMLSHASYVKDVSGEYI